MQPFCPARPAAAQSARRRQCRSIRGRVAEQQRPSPTPPYICPRRQCSVRNTVRARALVSLNLSLSLSRSPAVSILLAERATQQHNAAHTNRPDVLIREGEFKRAERPKCHSRLCMRGRGWSVGDALTVFSRVLMHFAKTRGEGAAVVRCCIVR